MARLLSVNVGMPRDVEWRGKTVRTAIWKEPVEGRRRVCRLNVEGDGQADLAGHGGEQRAVLVYQIESYRYWEERLGRSGFVHGQFGENFTVEGLPDNEVCIGDQYRIGTVLLEVTQPRVTCYRLGIRLNEPRMAALVTASGRPGFYCRVLEEGVVGTGDPILQIAKGPERMTVSEVNALLYTSSHPRDQLDRALRIPALSPGWRWSFETIARREETDPEATGNAGLMPAAAAQTAAPGFRGLQVARIDFECSNVISLKLRPVDGRSLTTPVAGQFIVLRLRPGPGAAPLCRSYSLSGSASDKDYRISVKVEPNSAAGTYLSTGIRTGDIIEVSEPRGSFALRPSDGPVVLASAGIGATPVLAMLHALAAGGTSREVWWLHNARNGKTHPFAAETQQVLGTLTRGRRQIWFSRPEPEDRPGTDYHAVGRMTVNGFDPLGVPPESDFYLCGPLGFMEELSADLIAWGVPAERLHSERFSGVASPKPSLPLGQARAPHQPDGSPGTGPLVSFARSGIAVRWRSDDQSLLELAEACDVPVRWSCRTGVCHNCESGLISGDVSYQPDPLDPPADGNLLICCSRPEGDVVIDL